MLRMSISKGQLSGIPWATVLFSSVTCMQLPCMHSSNDVLAPVQQAVSCPAHPVTNYTVTLTSSISTPIIRTVTTPPKDNVSITVGGLNDNTLYTYQVHANNAIGSAASAVKTFCKCLYIFITKMYRSSLYCLAKTCCVQICKI